MTRKSSLRATTPILVDAHVHFHDCFACETFFDSAAANFNRGARELDLATAHTGCLLFTESANQDYFSELGEACDRESHGPWTFTATDEQGSLLARRGPHEILVVAGRQVATQEGLEVLALGTTSTFPDGLELADTIEMVREQGALAVIPWGFGKWWFSRGRLVRQLVESTQSGTMFLGDNSGRLRFGRRPGILARAAARDMLVLPGSDPLPFPAQVKKPGAYGFAVRCAIDESRPAGSIKDHLRALREQPAVYGERERLWSFLRNQVMMQMRKHGRASARRS